MSQILALLQDGASTDSTLLMILGIIALAALVALGLKFFTNLFEVITAPTASIGHHGQNDNFFFSLMIVFLGGLIATFVVLLNQPQIAGYFHEYSAAVADGAASSGVNPVYRSIASEWGTNVMDENFRIYGADNFVFLPVVLVLLWLVVGTVAFIGSKLFGGQATLGNFLGSLAYGALFFNIGLGLCIPSAMKIVADSVSQGTPQPDVMAIIGAIVMIYGLVLNLIAIGQSASLSSGQVFGTLIVLLLVVGGLTYLAISMATPKFDDFLSQIQTYDPSR